MSDMQEDYDDIPRHTHGLLEAEERLNEATLNTMIHSTDNSCNLLTRVRVEDLKLVLRELNGLKQFDPR